MAVFGRFTRNARFSFQIAEEEARRMFKSEVDPSHVLIGILSANTTKASEILRQNGLEMEALREMVEKLSVLDVKKPEDIYYSASLKYVIEESIKMANQGGAPIVTTEHILYSIVKMNEAPVSIILERFGVDRERVLTSLSNYLNSLRGFNQGGYQDEDGFDEEAADDGEALQKYTLDLNELAIKDKIDPVIGRASEIERLIQILMRRTKNNPVLIGEPGVGKTAIAEGLAQRIVSGNVPEIIRDKKIFSLDLTSLIAGSKYRGEFESRIKNLLEELRERDDVILFIDEIHTIVGAGSSEGSLDASNILKPYLTRGEIQIIGATTVDEYRKYVEKDAALERRLQTIMVEEPSEEDAIKIIEGLKDKYEAHHRVLISHEAIEAAVTLSKRYISDRYLPDKAIDLIDEAQSLVRMKNYVRPLSLKEIEDELKEIASEKIQAIQAQDFEKAAQLRDKERELKDKMDLDRTEWKQKSELNSMKISFDDIARVVSKWTGIPVEKLSEEEKEKLLNLDKKLKSRVIGQDEAIDVLSHSIKRARVGLKDKNKPIGSFIFVGPTGVGKTYLAKALAESLFNDENAMIRIDMSEYMEKYSVSKLIGSPPGYVGYDEGGQLTEAIRKKPFSVVLFDEIEKAHPDVFNALLQLLDDGRLTDSKGRTVDFKNAVIIMTSNVGASRFKKQNTYGFGDASSEEKSEKKKISEIANEELKKTFRPEFLNRVDDIVVFNQLKENDIEKIVHLMAEDLKAKLKEMGLNIEIDKSVEDEIAKKGFDLEYGARPLERTFKKMIEDRLSEEILKNNVSKDKSITIYYNGKELEFKNGKEEELVQV